MRRLALCCCAVALAACAKPENKAPAESAAAMPRPIALADVAGKWTVKAMNEAKDTTLVTYELTATADTSGWTTTFPGRPPIPMRVSTLGSNIIADVGPYPSVLRKGVQVWTHSVLRLDNGKLVGTSMAHYTTTGADSVRRIMAEGTREP
jgi:hypothetical protein